MPLLEQAIDELRKCSPAEQNTIAALMLAEINALAAARISRGQGSAVPGRESPGAI